MKWHGIKLSTWIRKFLVHTSSNHLPPLTTNFHTIHLLHSKSFPHWNARRICLPSQATNPTIWTSRYVTPLHSANGELHRVTEMAGIKNTNDGWFCKLGLGTGRQTSTILSRWTSTLKDETIIFFQNIRSQPSDISSRSRTDNSSLHWRARFVKQLTTKHLSSKHVNTEEFVKQTNK